MAVTKYAAQFTYQRSWAENGFAMEFSTLADRLDRFQNVQMAKHGSIATITAFGPPEELKQFRGLVTLWLAWNHPASGTLNGVDFTVTYFTKD